MKSLKALRHLRFLEKSLKLDIFWIFEEIWKCFISSKIAAGLKEKCAFRMLLNLLIQEVQIVHRLFLVSCYLLHVPRLPSQPASSGRGWVIDVFWLELPWQYIAMTRNNISIFLYPWYPCSFDWFSWRWSKKRKKKFWQKIFKMANSKKKEFFKIPNSQKKIVKNFWVFLSRPFWNSFLNLFFFASSPWKSVKATWVSRMGPNDDYPGLQQKIKCA